MNRWGTTTRTPRLGMWLDPWCSTSWRRPSCAAKRRGWRRRRPRRRRPGQQRRPISRNRSSPRAPPTKRLPSRPPRTARSRRSTTSSKRGASRSALTGAPRRGRQPIGTRHPAGPILLRVGGGERNPPQPEPVVVPPPEGPPRGEQPRRRVWRALPAQRHTGTGAARWRWTQSRKRGWGEVSRAGLVCEGGACSPCAPRI
mmetsp:Transcript_25747/g.48824  ORF Transcript_25747/g.48824 Transcript_25747/m.48824 type:complete len:200 (+) Transcript_25747:1000-1599(+)